MLSAQWYDVLWFWGVGFYSRHGLFGPDFQPTHTELYTLHKVDSGKNTEGPIVCCFVVQTVGKQHKGSQFQFCCCSDSGQTTHKVPLFVVQNRDAQSH